MKKNGAKVKKLAVAKGKIVKPEKEGNVEILTEGDSIVMNFGAPISYVRLSKEQANSIGEALKIRSGFSAMAEFKKYLQQYSEVNPALDLQVNTIINFITQKKMMDAAGEKKA